MRYRSEKKGGMQHAYQPTGVAWLIGFPGYIIFLLSWVWVAGVACLKLGDALISGNGPTGGSQPSLNLAIGENGASSPLLISLLWIFVLLCLTFAYWALANFTIRTIARLADFLETSVWTVKGVGLVLGCGLAAVAATVFHHGAGVQALDTAAVFCGIGLCSFGFEYMHSRRIIAAEHDK